MRYSDELIEEIRSKNDILDIVGSYVHLQKRGSTYFGLCPFHNEKTPSFSVTPSKQMYYCFGCQKGGNVFTFLQEYENYTFKEALEVLAQKAGVELPENDYSEEDKRKDTRRKRMLEINKEAAIYYAHQLRSPQGEAGYKYLTGRGLTDETLLKFGLGFANVTSDDLVRYLRQKGFEDQLMIDAGLAGFDEKYGLHDKFWNRVMYPIQDANHRVIGFGGRVMGDAKPKYLNSKETEVFDKSRNLYGLNLVRSSRAGYIILCEGYMDVIAMHQAGFDMAAASLGTAFTSGQATLVRRFASKVYLAYDSDTAGTNAALKAIGILKDIDMSCRIINMEPYKDPDEFIKNLGKDEFQKRIDDAMDSFFFELKILERDHDLKDAESRTEFLHKAAEKLCEFEDEIRRENYIVATADKYSVTADQLRRLVIQKAAKGAGLKRELPKPSTVKTVTNEDLVLTKQRYLITWLSEEPSIFSIVKKYIEPSDFTDPLYMEVARQMYADLEAGRLNPAAIISTFDDENDQSKVASLFNTTLVIDNGNDRGQALHDVIYMVKKNAVESRSMSGTVDAESIIRQMNDKKALEELRKANITL
ncbi:MAG: DNA primase [Lachnospiraceae bacterium]|nr:DNA primase [Lachnospiraceae bacterium]